MKPFLEKHFGKFWLAAVYLFLYLPLFFMIVFSFNSTRQDANFTGFSLRWYEALTRDTKIVEGFWLSVKVATVTGVLSAVLGTFAALLALSGNLAQAQAVYRIVGPDGALHGINLPEMIREARATLTGNGAEQVKEARQTDFSALTASFQIADGIARSKDIQLFAPALRVKGEGQTAQVL